MRNMRHIVDVMRPANDNLQSRGQSTSAPAIVLADVPCSIVQTGGTEGDQADGTFADATFQVEMYGDPDKPILPRDFLQFGKRRLDIISVVDVSQTGLALTLTCGERVDG